MAYITEYEDFPSNNLYQALGKVESAGYTASYAPEVACARIADSSWHRPYATTSIRIDGTTKRGSRIVVYSHIPNHFSDSKNIQAALNCLRNGAAEYPEEKFYEIVEHEDGKNVFVLDRHDALKAACGVMSIDEALGNVHTIPLIGEQAASYLIGYREKRGEYIEVYYTESADSVPRARPIFIDLRLHLIRDGSLCGSLGGGSFGKPGCYLGRLKKSLC